jgi:hypothetical protein
MFRIRKNIFLKILDPDQIFLNAGDCRARLECIFYLIFSASSLTFFSFLLLCVHIWLFLPMKKQNILLLWRFGVLTENRYISLTACFICEIFRKISFPNGNVLEIAGTGKMFLCIGLVPTLILSTGITDRYRYIL